VKAIMGSEAPPIISAAGKLEKSVFYKRNGVEDTVFGSQIIGSLKQAEPGIAAKTALPPYGICGSERRSAESTK